MVFCLKAIRKPDSVSDSNLSGLLITRELNAALPLRGTTLHSGKDLAVSPRHFYPYSRVKPSTLGLGSPIPFGLGRHCSHLYILIRRVLPATLLRDIFSLTPHCEINK